MQRLLTEKLILERVKRSEARLELIQTDSKDFWRKVVVVDETDPPL